jgi:hypothetical protein
MPRDLDDPAGPMVWVGEHEANQTGSPADGDPDMSSELPVVLRFDDGFHKGALPFRLVLKRGR